MGCNPNKHFRKAKMASVLTLALLAVCALPWKPPRKRPEAFFLRFRPFTGLADALCGPLHDDKFFFVHAVQHTVKVFPALVLSVVPVRVEKFIHGNIKKGDELVKGIPGYESRL